MIYHTITKPVKEWQGPNGLVMELVAVFNPNEEDDPWVEFENVNTKQRYTCRQEAFLARYTPRVN
jgi:hypothetical protein